MKYDTINVKVTEGVSLAAVPYIGGGVGRWMIFATVADPEHRTTLSNATMTVKTGDTEQTIPTWIAVAEGVYMRRNRLHATDDDKVVATLTSEGIPLLPEEERERIESRSKATAAASKAGSAIGDVLNAVEAGTLSKAEASKALEASGLPPAAIKAMLATVKA